MEDKIECPKCGPKDKIRYGKSKGIQKYKCKICDRIFQEESKQPKYTKTEKRLLSMLMNFLEGDTNKEYALADFLEQSKVNHKNIGRIQLKQEKCIGQSNDVIVSCYNPRLIICEDSKGILLIKLPKYSFLSRETKEQKIVIKNSPDCEGLRVEIIEQS